MNLLKLVHGIFGKITRQVGWLGPLFVRLTVGVVFIGSGWGKLHDVDKVTGFFTDLGIPAPHFQAILVACTELIGGALVTVGLFTRFAAAPLAFTMIIAILTAKRAEVDGITTLFGFEEWSYLVMFGLLALSGAGAASLDHLLVKRLKLSPAPAATTA